MLAAVVGIVSFGSVYIVWKETAKPHAPAVPVVSICKSPAPGMKRIPGKGGYQFDFLQEQFYMHEGVSDSPPWRFAFSLEPKDGTAALAINFRDSTMNRMVWDRAYNFSGHVEHRQIFDEQGHPIGEDYWGYWENGERWRRFLLFKGGINATYDLADTTEAALFDRVLNSTCILDVAP